MACAAMNVLNESCTRERSLYRKHAVMKHMSRNIHAKTLLQREQGLCACLQAAQTILLHSVSIVNLIQHQCVASKIKVIEWAFLKFLLLCIWADLISSKKEKALWSPHVPVAKWWMTTIKGDVSFDSANQTTTVTATQPLASWNITALKSTLLNIHQWTVFIG